MKKLIFNKKQIDFIKLNYPTKGARWCSQQLNLSIKQIRSKVGKMKLSMIPENKGKTLFKTKNFNKYAVNPNNFLSVNSPESAYLLGLIWADGNINAYNGQYRISISLLKKDMENVEWIFDKTGKWVKYNFQSKNRQPQKLLFINNKPIYNFLLENNYKSKSGESASKIIEKIPVELRVYFFRGLVDGDGCIYANKNLNRTEFSISSTFEQEWDFIQDLCNYLDIYSFNIKRKKTKTGSYSQISITKQKDLIKLFDYIYSSYKIDGIGFFRKYEKYKECLDIFLIRSNPHQS